MPAATKQNTRQRIQTSRKRRELDAQAKRKSQQMVTQETLLKQWERVNMYHYISIDIYARAPTKTEIRRFTAYYRTIGVGMVHDVSFGHQVRSLFRNSLKMKTAKKD